MEVGSIGVIAAYIKGVDTVQRMRGKVLSLLERVREAFSFTRMARRRRSSSSGGGGQNIITVFGVALVTLLILFLIIAQLEPQIVKYINGTDWYTYYVAFKGSILAGLGLVFVGFIVLGASYIWNVAKSALGFS